MPIGRIGPEIVVNQEPDASDPAVTTLADGRFLVTWTISSSGNNDVYGRIFGPDGSPAGNNFIVDTTVPGYQYASGVAGLLNGGFVVAWQSFPNTAGSTYDIYARFFNANGTGGGDFIVDTTTTSDQTAASVTTLSDGRVVVTWNSSDNGTDYDIRARIFNADGSPAGDDFLVNTTVAGNQEFPAVTALANGRFVVIWTIYDGGNSETHARLYNADGSADGTEFALDSTTGHQEFPAVTALANGGFDATWEFTNSTDYDIRARIFDAEGTAAGGDFVVNSTTAGSQGFPKVTALADGRFVVAWESNEHGMDYDIRARIFNADGTADGDGFVIGTLTAGNQLNPDVTALADGRFVVAWDSGDVETDNIRSQIFDPTVFNGTAASEVWQGGSFGDMISGGGGNDLLYGRDGDDLIGGGDGNDTILDGLGDDHVFGNAGNDALYGGSGANVLDGGSGRDLSWFGFTSDQASITHLANGSWQISYDGVIDVVDTLRSIEVARFTDRDVSLRQAAVSDFDGSDVSDVLWRNTNGMTMAWQMSNGSNSGFTTVDWVSSTWSLGGIGDFNGDGTADILWRSAGTVTVWMIGEGTHTGSTTVGGAGGSWSISGVGDFNGDGTADILWRDASGTVATWEMTNSLHTGSTVITSPGGTWNINGVGDFNGDGTSDILWRNARGTVATWELSNGLRTGATSITSPGGTWNIAGVGDFNGDGTSDILWRNASGTLATWEMGDGQRTGTTYITNPGGTWSIAGVGDYNGDGTSDILWRDASGTVAVWQMQNGRMFASTGIAGPGSNWQVA
jgi:hypothetical protein